MKQLFKKTWLLFYIIAFSGFMLLSMSLFYQYEELEYEIKTEQRYATKLFESYISSAFFQFASLLDLISYESTVHKNLNIDIIDKVLSKNPLLIGFALFNIDGSLESASPNLQTTRFPNLLTNEQTKLWFQEVLQHNKMSIARPYYLKELKKWVIPIRQRVVNEQGDVIGVIASGLDLKALSLQWDQNSSGKRTMQATLDTGLSRMIRSNLALNKYEQTYNTVVPSTFIKQLESELALQHLTLDSLRKSGQIAQLHIQQERGTYVSLLFNKKLQLWFSSIESNYSLKQTMLNNLFIYGVLYLFVLIIIFFLFKWVVRIEKDKITELTYRAEHDRLTGLYNRSILKKIKYHKSNKPFSLLYVDLDHFKAINDSYGYSYGDIILIEVSKRIKKGLKAVDGSAIRLSADEFIVLIDCIDKEKLRDYCQKLLAAINRPYVIKNTDFKISASIGIAQSPLNSSKIETLISYANNSMLIAKKTKNDYVFFSEKIYLQLIKNIEIEQALHSAIANNEITIVYQPQLDNQNELYGVEALVRWNNANLGFIPPDIFIPIAEKSGLMPELGAYIMDKAMADISTLQYKKKKSFKLSINVSARQFVQLNFFEVLMDCLNCYKSPYMEITLEITESLFIENINRLRPIFKKMKKERISLSLDDFGTGYSSLSMLRNVPIDELKIDKSFVDYIVYNKKDRAMVESIITMGKNLGMTVLAEGIETEQQADILQHNGCDIYQGYYFSKPLSLDMLEDFIDKHSVDAQELFNLQG